MSNPRFCRYVFRTTAGDEARSFYEAVLGGVGDGVVELSPAAVARGARPHWMGVIDVSTRGTTDEVAARFIERGATRLGPPGGDVAVLRDAGGAIVALGGPAAPSRAEIGWHQLNTADAPGAARIYSEILGWEASDERDLGALGKMRPLSWGPDDLSAGRAPRAGITGIEERPELHPHWWFFFVVPSMEKAIGEAVARGAKILGPTTLPDGDRIAVCDDPQGAGFGILERAGGGFDGE